MEDLECTIKQIIVYNTTNPYLRLPRQKQHMPKVQMADAIRCGGTTPLPPPPPPKKIIIKINEAIWMPPPGPTCLLEVPGDETRERMVGDQII